jgi:hypothetical protein
MFDANYIGLKREEWKNEDPIHNSNSFFCKKQWIVTEVAALREIKNEKNSYRRSICEAGTYQNR